MPAALPQIAPEGTRAALIGAGLHLFGHHSFAATSTRQIARHAQTNIASIAYHFGGKAGLRDACAAEIVRRIGAVIAEVPEDKTLSGPAARAHLRAVLRGMVGFLIGGSEADDVVPFLLRELTEGGPTLEIFYQGLVEPTHRRLCALWGAATGQDPGSEKVRLQVFGAIGQALYFRIGSRIVTRRMGWSALGPDEAFRITETLLGNLDALLDQQERS